MTQMFQLSQELQAHEQDVKDLISFNKTLVSCSRDTTVALFKNTGVFVPDRIYQQHSHFVNSLAYLPPSDMFPNGLVCSGSSDKTIHVFDPTHASEPVFLLTGTFINLSQGHSDNVCALDVSIKNDIVSGSWDHSIKIWKNYECVSTLTGHSHAVWDVLCLEKEYILSGTSSSFL
jgi:phospholipase A-2-activating protein